MNRIQELVHTGTIIEGERLPSIRSMAKQTGVSVMTVLEGYRRLENMGLIESRPQSGYFLLPKVIRTPELNSRLPEVSRSDIVLRTETVKIPEVVEQLVKQSARKDVIPLGNGAPIADYFPNEELSIHLARVVRTNPKVINSYAMGWGHPSLKEMISRWMIEAGCITREDEVVVTNGATQALMLALRAVTKPGDTVAVESPGYYGFYALLQFFNLKAVEIPSDPQSGLAVYALKSILEGGVHPACVLLSSCHSNPTGAVMPNENKEGLIKLCLKYNLPIIEDDTFGELTFNNYRPRPLKSLAPDNVLYVGSFSKILAPGYRIAWLAGGRHTNDIHRCFAMSVLGNSPVTQLALASYLKTGGLKRHLRSLRKKYKENVMLFQNKIAQCFPEGTRACSPQGGHFLWVELPEESDAVKLSIAAISDKISIAPGVLFSSRQHYRKYFRLNFAVKWSFEVETALERLGELAYLC
ncbi:PLP-dependent aminotransferase family protein [Desulfotomaculum defluvii]